MIRAAALLAAVAAAGACGAKDSRGGDPPRRDGGDAAPAGEAGPVARAPDAGAPASGPPAGAVEPYRLAAAGSDGGVAGGGTINVRVEWKDAPVAARRSPGRDPCGAPRPPQAAVHTLHGVRDVVVWLDGIERGKAPPPAATAAAVALRACRLEPAVQLAPRADAPLTVTNLDERRAAVELGWAEAPGGDVTVVARTALPVVGHAISAPQRPWLTRVTADAAGDDAAWIVVPPHPYAAVTDEAGAAALADGPAGTYTARAWLRPGAGQPARAAQAEVTVTAGAAVDVVLSLADGGAGAGAGSTTGDPGAGEPDDETP